jgi:hypothetical protein
VSKSVWVASKMGWVPSSLKSSEGDLSAPVGSKQSFHLKISAESCYLKSNWAIFAVASDGLPITADPT